MARSPIIIIPKSEKGSLVSVALSCKDLMEAYHRGNNQAIMLLMHRFYERIRMTAARYVNYDNDYTDEIIHKMREEYILKPKETRGKIFPVPKNFEAFFVHQTKLRSIDFLRKMQRQGEFEIPIFQLNGTEKEITDESLEEEIWRKEEEELINEQLGMIDVCAASLNKEERDFLNTWKKIDSGGNSILIKKYTMTSRQVSVFKQTIKRKLWSCFRNKRYTQKEKSPVKSHNLK